MPAAARFRSPVRCSTLPALGLLALAAAWAAPACAVEVYAPLGVPGAGLGVAVPMGSAWGLRADWMTLGQRSKSTVESGISYDGRYKLQRGAALVDLFPFGGSFRLSLGAAFNTYQVVLDANGASGSITVGDRTYTTTAADGITATVEFPRSTPYVGIGWGHHAGKGWRFSADIGAAIGTARVSAVARGALAGQPDIQDNLDKELAELRDGVGKLRAMPQLSIGIGYSF